MTTKDKGKTSCDIAWVAAYLEAATEAKRTNKTVGVKGFPNFKVSPRQEFYDDEEQTP